MKEIRSIEKRPSKLVKVKAQLSLKSRRNCLSRRGCLRAAFKIMLDLAKIVNFTKFKTAVRRSNGLCELDLDNFADFVVLR